MRAVEPLGKALQNPFHELRQIVHPIGKPLVGRHHRFIRLKARPSVMTETVSNIGQKFAALNAALRPLKRFWLPRFLWIEINLP